MKTTKELLGARIKELRKLRKLSQEQLSEKIDIDPRHLSRIEVGRSYPSLDTLEKTAKALNVELKDLFEFIHHLKRKDLIKNIKRPLNPSDEDKLKLILLILNTA